MEMRELPFYGRINDSHAHVWLGQRLKNRAAKSGRISATGEAETLLALMEQNGVNSVAIITPTTLGFDNSVTLELSRTYKERFVPIARIDPYGIKLESRINQLLCMGARGFRISTNNSKDGSPLGDPVLEPLAKVLSNEQVPLFLHCNFDQLHLVDQLAADNPELPILIDHMARVSSDIDINGPIFKELTSLARYKNIKVKISSTNYFAKEPMKHSDLIPYIERLLADYGDERLLWGSDWPLSEVDSKYVDAFEPLLTMASQFGIGTLERLLVDNFNSLFDNGKGKNREAQLTGGICAKNP